MFKRAKEKARALIKDQKRQFGIDEKGVKDAEAAAIHYAEERRQDRVKKGKEEDKHEMQWDAVKYVDRYGEDHFVSSAMAAEMGKREEEDMLELELEGKLPPPKIPRLFKDPDYNAIQIKINWSVPNDFGTKDSIKHCILKWSKTNNQHTDQHDIWSTSKARVEYISTKTKEDKELFDDNETMKIVKNKRARFVEIRNLYPATEYEFLASFVYTETALNEFIEQGGKLNNKNSDESEPSDPLVVRTADALLQCSNCGSTLNWGIEECPDPNCLGSSVSFHAWNK